LPSTVLAPSLFLLWKPGAPSHHLDLTLFSLSCRKRWNRRCHHRRRSNHGGTPGPALAPACKICDCHHHLRPHLDQFQPSPDPDTLGKLTPCETLAGVELSRAHAWQTATTTVGRRSSPNRMARTLPYRFVHPGLAGEPTGLDPAQIWPGLARFGPFLFFSFLCFIYLLIKCCDLNQFKNVLGLRKI
jgi:hypothetical protein